MSRLALDAIRMLEAREPGRLLDPWTARRLSWMLCFGCDKKGGTIATGGHDALAPSFRLWHRKCYKTARDRGEL